MASYRQAPLRRPDGRETSISENAEEPEQVELRSDASASHRDALFVTDAEIIRRLGVSEKVGYAAIHRLEKSGLDFPEKQRVWGKKRWWPAVLAWFDDHYGFHPTGRDRSR
jgi:hypothetical protein